MLSDDHLWARDIGQPFITFTTHGRNDDYMGNAVWRMEMSLNSLGYSLDRLGLLDQCEALVCDWGSAVPLSQALHLTPSAHQITRFVYVPPALAAELQKDSGYPVVLCMNTAIRRARGAFVTMSDMDAFYTPETVGRLFAVLRGEISTGVADVNRAMFCGPRRHIPYPVVAYEPDGLSLQRFIRDYGHFLCADRIDNHALAPAVVTVAHRGIWHELRGYEETMLYYQAMDIDLIVRLTKRYPAVHLGRDAGLIFFHLEHYSSPSKRQTRGKINRYVEPSQFTANGKGWGLGAYDLFICKPELPPVSDGVPRIVPRVLAVRSVLKQSMRYLEIYTREDLNLLIGPFTYRWNRLRALLGGQPIPKWSGILRGAVQKHKHNKTLLTQSQPYFDWNALRATQNRRRLRAGIMLLGCLLAAFMGILLLQKNVSVKLI